MMIVDPNMSWADYRAYPAAHYSGLKDVAVSPAYYQWRRANPWKPSPVALKGTAIGFLLSDGIVEYRNRYTTPPLTPDQLPEWMECQPAGFTGQKKADKELIAAKAAVGIIVCKLEDFNEHGLNTATKAGGLWADKIRSMGQIPVSMSDDCDITECVEAIRAHPLAGPIVARARHEVSVIAEINGVMCKGRIDIDCAPELIADLKTSESVEPKKFRSKIEQFCYHWQAAMYLDLSRAAGLGTDSTEWRWIVAEPTAPYHVRLSKPLSERAYAIGREEYQGALRLLQACQMVDRWPSDNGEEADYDLSRWYGQ